MIGLNEKIEELRVFESNLQAMMAQKQGIQMEISEIENALAELENYDDEAYKIISGAMIKVDAKKIVEELELKKRILDEKIDANEKQEAILEGKVKEIRDEINSIAKKTTK